MTTHAGLYGPEALLDAAGRPRRLTNVVVYQADGTTPAVLYTDRTKSTQLTSNAVQTTSDALLSFYAAPGMYVIRWVTAGTTHTATVEVPVDYADVGSGPGSAVTSVFGRVGDVVLAKADVLATGLAAADVGAATTAAVTSEQARAQGVEATKADLVSGVVPLAQIPPAAFELVQNVATVSAMLALSVGGKGALVRVADDGDGSPALFLLPAGADPTNESHWVEVSMDAEGAAAAALASAQSYTNSAVASRQPLDSDLTAIAALDATSAGALVTDGAGWIKKTYAQLKAALGITTSDVSGLGSAATHAATDFDTSGAATSAVATHVAATDPHADRAYTDAKVAALVNSAPSILDTLGEIAAQLQSDESAATALATTVAGKQNVVVHGSTASTARPGGATVVHWIGSVAPTNAVTNDEWTDTTVPVVKRWTGSAWVSLTGASTTPTAVKTGNYTAAAGDIVPVSTASGAVTVTLPTAPADKSLVTVKLVTQGGTNGVTVAAGGSDRFNVAGGAATVSLVLLRESVQLQYAASSSLWYVLASDTPVSQLDSRYKVTSLGLAGPGWVPVADACLPLQTASLSNGTDTNNTYVQFHTVLDRVGSIRLVYTNWYGHETEGLNAITVKAAVKLSSQTYFQSALIAVTFQGAASVTIAPGGTVMSDPIGIDMDPTVQTGFFTYSNVSVGSAGMKWPLGQYTWRTQTGVTVGSDTTGSGAIPTFGNNPAYSPFMIVGTRKNKSAALVALIGDSITAGKGDSVSGNTAWLGWAENGCVTRGYSYLKVAENAEEAGQWIFRNSSKRRRAWLDGCTHAIITYGENDINGGVSAATLEGYVTSEWWSFWARGMKVYAGTVTPYTDSTDGWNTTTNQTLHNSTNEVQRVAFNTWVRAGGPLDPTAKTPVAVGTAGALVAGDGNHPLSGVIDICSVVESAQDSGKWKAGIYSGDGIHPNATGHAAIAALIPTGWTA